MPQRSDWSQAQQKAKPLLDKRGRDLLAELGYQVSDTNQQYAILRCGQTKMAVAVFLDRSEACDIASDRFGGMTPVQYALAKADDENLDYVLVDHGSSLRIHTAAGKGVGRRGRTETFVEIHLDLLPSDGAGYLWLLFSGAALSKDGSFSRILEESQDYASDLGSRLRDRIYDFVVPRLAIAIAKARNLKKPTAARPQAHLRDGAVGPVPAAVHRLRGRQRPAAVPHQRALPRPFAEEEGPRHGNLRRVRRLAASATASGCTSIPSSTTATRTGKKRCGCSAW